MAHAQPVTRSTLRRGLIVNAARKPRGIGLGAMVAVAALVLDTPWLLLVALLVYLGMATSTFFDGDEAERVGRALYARARAVAQAPRGLPVALAPELAALVERARTEEQRIVETIAEAHLPFHEVSVEVDGLAGEMERIATRAQVIETYLAGHDADELRRRRGELRATAGGEPGVEQARERAATAIDDQLRLAASLRDELNRFRAEMEHLIASLAVVHGQLVRISVSDDPGLQEDVAREVRDLRGRVGDLADGLRHAAAGLPDESDGA